MGGRGARPAGSDAPCVPHHVRPWGSRFSLPILVFSSGGFSKHSPEQGRRPAPLAPPFSTSFRTDTSDFITRCSRRQED